MITCELQEIFYKDFIINNTYCERALKITETDVVDSYVISWHICIKMLFIQQLDFCVEKLVLNPLTISSYQSFIDNAKGINGMLLNGNRTVRIQRYRRVIPISAPRSCNFSSALCGNCILKVPHYRRVGCICIYTNVNSTTNHYSLMYLYRVTL